MQVKDIQGLSERIADGQLHLRLKDFLELVLKNSTDVHLTQLDVYTAAHQITAAKAPFDPTLGLQFNTLRSVSPLFFGKDSGQGRPEMSGRRARRWADTAAVPATGVGANRSHVAPDHQQLVAEL